MISANHHGFEYFPEESSWQPRVSGGGIIGGDITDGAVVDPLLWRKISGRSVAWTTDYVYNDHAHLARQSERLGYDLAEAQEEFETAIMETVEPKDTTPEVMSLWERLRAEEEAAAGKTPVERYPAMPTLAEEHAAMKDRRALKRARDLIYKTVDRE